MCKTSLILELYKDGKITEEQAKLLMETEVRYVYYSTPYTSPYTVTCTTNNGSFTSTT